MKCTSLLVSNPLISFDISTQWDNTGVTTHVSTQWDNKGVSFDICSSPGEASEEQPTEAVQVQ